MAVNDEPINEPINEPIKLTDRELTVLQMMKHNAEITRREMVIEMQCSESTVKRAIDGLLDKAVIRRVGSKKKGSWEILKDVQ